MAKVVSLANQKGGVGKTTTTINLAAGLALLKKKILVVDMDPQGNCTSGLGIPPEERAPGIYEALIGGVPVEKVVRKTETGRLFLIPSTRDLIGAEVEFVGLEGRANILRRTLRPLLEDFDFVLIDCPPSLGLLTINGLVASESVLVPLQAEYYALEGLSQLLETVDLVAKDYHEGLTIEGILLTMIDRRTNLGRQVEQEVRDHFGARVFDTVVPRNVRLSEAPSFGRTIFQHDIRSAGAQAFLSLAREFIERNREEPVTERENFSFETLAELETKRA